MTDQPQGQDTQGPETTTVRAGDNRGGDRRAQDRRRTDRRAPLPAWRRPWAYVAYGLLGGLAVVLLLTRVGGEEEPVTAGIETTTALPAVDTVGQPAARAPLQDAYTVGDFERLLAEGAGAAGQRVRTTLYCGAISSVSLNAAAPISPSVAALADAGGRVPGAECRWGQDQNAPNFFLLVPASLAERFAAAREVETGFVRRRRVQAEVEWIGRSQALALRNAGVLRAIL